MTSLIGSRVPPPVSPLPAAVCSSASVVVMMIEAGKPFVLAQFSRGQQCS
jgi:hypothetical protein